MPSWEVRSWILILLQNESKRNSLSQTNQWKITPLYDFVEGPLQRNHHSGHHLIQELVRLLRYSKHHWWKGRILGRSEDACGSWGHECLGPNKPKTTVKNSHNKIKFGFITVIEFTYLFTNCIIKLIGTMLANLLIPSSDCTQFENTFWWTRLCSCSWSLFPWLTSTQNLTSVGEGARFRISSSGFFCLSRPTCSALFLLQVFLPSTFFIASLECLFIGEEVMLYYFEEIHRHPS